MRSADLTGGEDQDSRPQALPMQAGQGLGLQPPSLPKVRPGNREAVKGRRRQRIRQSVAEAIGQRRADEPHAPARTDVFQAAPDGLRRRKHIRHGEPQQAVEEASQAHARSRAREQLHVRLPVGLHASPRRRHLGTDVDSDDLTGWSDGANQEGEAGAAAAPHLQDRVSGRRMQPLDGASAHRECAQEESVRKRATRRQQAMIALPSGRPAATRLPGAHPRTDRARADGDPREDRRA